MSHLRQHHSGGTIALASGAAAAALRLRAAAWELPVIEAPGQLSLHVWGCELRLSEQGGGLKLDLSGPERRLVDTLRDSATEIMAEAGLTVAWDHVNVGALAPGLSLAQVASVTQRTRGFIRVRLTGPDLGRFARGSLHFRLLIAPEGRAPVWPRVAASGRAVWPDGPDALHRPVYTVAELGEGWVDFDIFRHAGSPTCDWADRVRPGEAVGIIGPGGGWCPEAADLHLYGDETALPAIARMLTLAKGAVTATLRCAPDDMGTLAGDLRVRRCDDLLDSLLTAPPAAAEGRFLWFASRAEQARKARTHLQAQGWQKPAFTCAAYWD